MNLLTQLQAMNQKEVKKKVHIQSKNSERSLITLKRYENVMQSWAYPEKIEDDLGLRRLSSRTQLTKMLKLGLVERRKKNNRFEWRWKNAS